MSGWTVFWATWAAAGAGAEVIALLDRAPGDTLSEQVWPIVQGSSFAKFMAAAFLLWAAFHFTFEGK